ncbi:sodium-coupled monocarboxylate transporter 1-like [Cylas formicarius]|uniref:sodium-coupled monocarboxylate transporter 1-like n=1 Tax=Cylas formicarius TaxID=197179 RepID=UPI00295868BE|nr:sodium-coupled monocarboxylate transporter 1-like [Cylas formicarius]
MDDYMKETLGLEVEDVEQAMKKFAWADYMVFLLMLAMCLVIGAYFGFWKKSSGAQDYLVGGRNMKTLPVAMSLVASYISGISLLGIPTEVYVYGIQYAYILGGFLLMSLVMSYVYLPVFHGLNLTSTYEYLEMRFDKKVHLFGSLLFAISTITWLPLVIYVPALAFNQVTGINVHLITPVVCVICIFYTSMGGIKAVVWTDVIQIVIMFGATFLVAAKGTIDVGGLESLVHRNLDSGRIEGPNLDIDPMARHTLWSLVIGGFFHVMHSGAVNQNMVQRYLALPSLRAARVALWLFFVGVVVIVSTCSYLGLLIYATFHKCDPLTTMLAREKDQLLPLLVMVVLGDFPGLPGICLAGNFSAALSSLSTGLNSMAAVVLEDFYKPFFRRDLTREQTNLLMKLTVIIFGCICVALVFIAEKMGQVLQLQISISAISNGPALGIFTMGMMIPWINAQGCLIGGVSSLVIMSWWCIRTTSLVASGDLTFPEKPVSTDGCHYSFTPKHSRLSTNFSDIVHTDEKFMIYRLSYLWYTLVGTFLAIFIGLVASFMNKPEDPRDVDPKLLAPFVRKWIKPREYPNEPTDGIIYAYGSSQEYKENGARDRVSNNDIPLEDRKVAEIS